MELKFEELSLQVTPDNLHEWILDTKSVSLGYGVAPETVRYHKSSNAEEFIENKHFISVGNPNGFTNQPVTYWTKRGVIRLGFLIKSERGRKFRDWCEDVIINQIPVSIPKTLSQALRLAADQAEEIERQQIMIQEMEPKALVADKLLASGDGLSFKEFGSMIGVGQNTLFEFMRRDGYLISEGKRHNLPYQKYLDQELLMVREVVIETKVGNLLKPQTLVTPKGQSYFLKKYGK